MNDIPHFPRLLSSAVALILDSPLVVVQPMMYAVDLPDGKTNLGCLIENSIKWATIMPDDVQTMINDGAYINATNRSEGRTALHLAANAGNAAVIPILIKANADVNAADNYADTPLDLAKKGRHWAAAIELEKAGGECCSPIVRQINGIAYMLEAKQI